MAPSAHGDCFGVAIGLERALGGEQGAQGRVGCTGLPGQREGLGGTPIVERVPASHAEAEPHPPSLLDGVGVGRHLGEQLERLPAGAPARSAASARFGSDEQDTGQPADEIGLHFSCQWPSARAAAARPRPSGRHRPWPGSRWRLATPSRRLPVVQVELHQTELLVGHGVERCRLE